MFIRALIPEIRTHVKRMGCFTFDEMLTTAQNHWSADHAEADSQLYAITHPQNSMVYKPIEEMNPTIMIPQGNTKETIPKQQESSNISELIDRFENLVLNRLGSRPYIVCQNCGKPGHYTRDCYFLKRNSSTYYDRNPGRDNRDNRRNPQDNQRIPQDNRSDRNNQNNYRNSNNRNYLNNQNRNSNNNNMNNPIR